MSWPVLGEQAGAEPSFHVPGGAWQDRAALQPPRGLVLGLAVAGQAASSTASLMLPVRERDGCAVPQHHDPGRADWSLAPHTGQRESGTE